MPRDRDGGCGRQAGPLDRGWTGIAAGLGEQQNFVGMAQAKSRPCGVLTVGCEIHRAAARFDLVDISGKRIVAPSDRVNGGDAEAFGDLIGGDHRYRLRLRSLRVAQALGEIDGVQPGRDRKHADVHRNERRPALALLVTESPDHDPHHRHFDIGVLRDRVLDHRARHLDKQGIAHRHDGRRTRLPGEQREFANGFTASDLAQDFLRAGFGLGEGVQPAGQDEVDVVADVSLAQQCRTGSEIDIVGFGLNGSQDPGVTGPEVVAKHGLEQRLALLKIGIGFRRQTATP